MAEGWASLLHHSQNAHFCPPGPAPCAGNSNEPDSPTTLEKVSIQTERDAEAAVCKPPGAVKGARAEMPRSPKEVVADLERHLGSVRREGH